MLLQEHWEWESATVLGIDLLDFHRIVAQEEVESVELLTAIVTVVLPEDSEREDFTVVVEERLEVLVGSATLQLDLVVVLVFCQIGRVLLHVDHGSGVGKWVIREGLWHADVDTLICIVSLGEIVTVDNSKHS